MRPMILLTALVLGGAVAPAGLCAHAEVRISAETFTAMSGKTSPTTMYFGADRLKMDVEKIAVIYRGDTGTVFNVMKDQHKYIAFDQATQQRMGAMMSAMQDQMRQRMQSLPEAQRKQMEAALGRAGAPESKAATPFEKTGKSKTVGAWTCQVFRKSLAGGMTIESCFAPLNAVGLTHDDLAALKGLMERMRKTLPKFGEMNSMNLDAQTQEIGFEGFPVQTITSAGGVTQTTSVVKSVEHVSLPADTFELPAGYAKQEMPGIGK